MKYHLVYLQNKSNKLTRRVQTKYGKNNLHHCEENMVIRKLTFKNPQQFQMYFILFYNDELSYYL